MPPLNKPLPKPPPNHTDLTSSLVDLQALYQPQTAARFQGVIIGFKGVGKTTLCETMVKPVLLDAIDPGDEVVLLEKDADGHLALPPWLLVRNQYQRGTADDFRQWSADTNALIAAGTFNKIGTYVLTLTTWADALIAKILSDVVGKPTQKGGVHGPAMELQDWGTFLSEGRYWLKTLLALPCHVVLQGHIQKHTNEVSGKVDYTILIGGALKDHLPVYASEVYWMECNTKLTSPKPGAKAIPVTERYLITCNEGQFRGSTRLGRKGLFEPHEPADIKALMAKAGMDTTDLPLPGEEENNG